MRTLISFAAAAALLACSPPAAPDRADAPSPTPPAPQQTACNAVTPDASRQVAVQAPLAAAAVSDLRGGAIAPGVYDLVSATRVDAATGWQGTRAVALAVTEAPNGVVTFDWAGAATSGETDRWTATFSEIPQARLNYTCGRMGEVDAAFVVQGEELRLRLPDGANGALDLVFDRR